MTRTLVVGGGGREHALAWKLAQEADVVCAPGNPGIAQEVEVAPTRADDFDGLTELARARRVDLVVVGPEDPLIRGLADRLRGEGLAVFGPGADGARLEGSKAFSKVLMRAAGVPTAEFATFTDARHAAEYARARFDRGHRVAVKASGNALGKGVVVCDDVEQAHSAIRSMIEERAFGEAGAEVVVEDRLHGRECSLLTLVGERNVVSLPVAQDHKRAFDGDRGPNTGGMGAVSPCDWVGPDLVAEVEERMVRPALAALREQGVAFRGVLFTGVMLDGGRPYCLEYNVRFGDPETQAVVLRLGAGLGRALRQAACGEWIEAPEVLSNAAVSVVVASVGYPGPYEQGRRIEVGPLPAGTKLFHAGTRMADGRLVTAGGRVFAAAASAPDLCAARRLAYAAAERAQFRGAFFRRDIGASERPSAPER